MEPFRFNQAEISVKEEPWWPSQWTDARRYQCGDDLRIAMELAINLGRPLLVTGVPGCGKTTAAYWAALKLGKTPPPPGGVNADEGVIHAQVRSSANEKTIKYSFDAVGYFREMQTADQARRQALATADVKKDFIHKGPLWRAFDNPGHVVLLFDEIDKAPPELPNDLLLELDRFRFEVPELGNEVIERAREMKDGKGKPLRFLVIITSNGQRPLPDAFLRRCLHHRIAMDLKGMKDIVLMRHKEPGLGFENGKDLDDAVELFFKATEKRDLRHQPGLSELIDWARAIGFEIRAGGEHETKVRKALADELAKLERNPGAELDRRLPYQTLLKTHDDARKALPDKRELE